MSGLQRRARPVAEQIYVLMPYDKREAMSIQAAAKQAGFSPSTIRNWCEDFSIGRRIGKGHWKVSRVALQMFVNNEMDALAAYHTGERSNPKVIAYFEKAGLGCLV